jgi:hypothetical protein
MLLQVSVGLMPGSGTCVILLDSVQVRGDYDLRLIGMQWWRVEVIMFIRRRCGMLFVKLIYQENLCWLLCAAKFLINRVTFIIQLNPS